MIPYTTYCSYLSFLTHVEGFEFIPIIGLWDITTYHPLAVRARLIRLRISTLFSRVDEYRFPFSATLDSEILRIYDL